MRNKIALIENMNQMNTPMPFGLTIHLDPLDHLRAVLPEDWQQGGRKYAGQLKVLEDLIQAIPEVEECEFGHANYVRIAGEASSFEEGNALYQKVEQAVRTAIVEWGEELRRL